MLKTSSRSPHYASSEVVALSRAPRPMKVPVIPPPTLEEIEKPAKSEDEIDTEISETSRSCVMVVERKKLLRLFSTRS